MRFGLAALAALLLLSGCASPNPSTADDWQPHACEAQDDPRLGGNAHLVALFEDDLDDALRQAARRLPAEVRDAREPAEAPPSQENEHYADVYLAEGSALLHAHRVGATRPEYDIRFPAATGWPGWAADDVGARVEAYLAETYGLPADALGSELEAQGDFLNGRHWQEFPGGRILVASSQTYVGADHRDAIDNSIGLHQAYRIDAGPLLTREQAHAIALAYDDCRLAGQGDARPEVPGVAASEPFWSIETRHDSLVYLVSVERGQPTQAGAGFCPAPSSLVWVDAETGAVHDWQAPQDCRGQAGPG